MYTFGQNISWLYRYETCQYDLGHVRGEYKVDVHVYFVLCSFAYTRGIGLYL